jgi:hypothetical protein
MAPRTKIYLNVTWVLILLGLAVFAYIELNQVTAFMVDDRVAHANFFTRMIRENWEGIKSFSDKEKKDLLELLDRERLAWDIRIMRFIIFILLFGSIAAGILDRIIAIFTLWKTSRRGVE